VSNTTNKGMVTETQSCGID